MSKADKIEKESSLELQPIDAQRVIRILENDVQPQTERDAKARGELSAAWKIIEDECGCNKKAAKLYYQLAGWSEEKKDDFLRSLYALMEAGGMGISEDLVDRIGDDGTPKMPVTAPGGPTVNDLATSTVN